MLITKYLEQGGRLTPLSALELFGCFRLAARIWELRRAGMVIGSTSVRVRNRYGRMVSVDEYFLEARQ
ncbi:hypothetical protein D3C76_1814610 [compost metagenome]